MPIPPRELENDCTARSPWARAVWGGLGLACLALGMLGAILPGLPTTPFLLLAAACFARSSKRLYDWLLGHRLFGPLIGDYRAGRGIPQRVKVLAIGTMWVFVGVALGPGLPRGSVALRVVVGIVALIGTAYLLRLPTKDAPREAGREAES